MRTRDLALSFWHAPPWHGRHRRFPLETAALPDRPGIEPFDTAGLLDATRRSWYPVLPDDLLGSRSKLEATADEVRRLLERCGFVSA